MAGLGAHPFSLGVSCDPQDCPLDRKFQAHQSSFPSAPGDEISLFKTSLSMSGSGVLMPFDYSKMIA